MPPRTPQRRTLLALAFALIAVPALGIAIGALAAAITDCSDSLTGPLAVSTLVSLAVAGAWAAHVRRPLWLVMTCAFGGGLFGALGSAVAVISVGFDRCFVF